MVSLFQEVHLLLLPEYQLLRHPNPKRQNVLEQEVCIQSVTYFSRSRCQVNKETRNRNKVITNDSSSTQPAPWDRASASEEETELRKARKLVEFTNILAQKMYLSSFS